MSYAYDTIADIIRLGEENNISFGDVVLRYELENYDRSEDAVVHEIENRLDIEYIVNIMRETLMAGKIKKHVGAIHLSPK